MGVIVDVTRVACAIGGGNQEIAFANLGGLISKTCIFIGSYGVTDGVAAAHKVSTFGLCDDTKGGGVAVSKMFPRFF